MANSTEKYRRLIRQFINEKFNCFNNYYETYKNWDSEKDSVFNCFDVVPYRIGLIGKGHFAIHEDYDKCKESFIKCYPDSDLNMVEYINYKGYHIIFD